jgi:hypothetical protein
MRMEPLLFADENTPEWAFSKRKGVNEKGVKWVETLEELKWHPCHFILKVMTDEVVNRTPKTCQLKNSSV